ncbi:MAG: restriction endonuclease subunit S [Oscillospiraceae bacterium]|nr:restriction endonuclease subunit S [Oscillospiraceae bacterium]
MVPQIRFKEFRGEWEERKLGEVSDIVRGASPRPIQDPKWFDANSDVGWLRISDVTEQNGRIHYLKQKISKLGQDKTRVLYEPHLLLSIAATVGKPVVNYVKTGVHDGFLIFLSPKFNQEFMFQWLEMFREKWGKYGQPGSQVNLNSELVKNQEIMMPSLLEQQQIGLFFFILDNIITIYQRELENIQKLKKSMLQKMFPKKGEDVPEVRFDGFTGVWEEKKLSDGTKKIGDGLHGTPSYNDIGEVAFINGNNLIYGEVVTTKDTKYVTEDKQSKDDKELNKNTILISINGTIGNLARYKNERLMLGKSIAYIEVKEFDKEFIYYYLQNPEIRYYFLSSLTGTTIKNLGLKTIRETKLSIPNVKEQIKIGIFLKQLDSLITLHQRNLETYRTLKKSLLQKMFI